MQCSKRKTATRLLQPFAAVELTAGALLLVPATQALMNPPQARPGAITSDPIPADAIAINIYF